RARRVPPAAGRSPAHGVSRRHDVRRAGGSAPGPRLPRRPRQRHGGRDRLPGKAGSMNAVIETQPLTKSYGPHRGIIDIDLTVGEGEAFGFLGPNGAGKTTTLPTLADHQREP